jgi:two-component system copper resistance phosphate regulon response regulator CusR
MKVLLVEDEQKISRYVTKALNAEGHEVEAIMRGDEGFVAATTRPFDIILLDLALPGRDGLEILRAIREKSIATPVLILTARGDLPDRIQGLDLGADDYLPKPFALEELLARVSALTRRKGSDNSPLLRVADLVLNETTREVTRNGSKLYLSVREFGLLNFLMRHVGRAFTRTELCEHVWKSSLDDETNAVDVYIQRVRRKVDEDFPVKLIQTVRNVGYKIEAPLAAA